MTRDREWKCKIGVLGDLKLPPGSDGPMREAIARAFRELTGVKADFIFSGWETDSLTEGEYNVAKEKPSEVYIAGDASIADSRCFNCLGYGKIGFSRITCRTCKGKGFIPS